MMEMDISRAILLPPAASSHWDSMVWSSIGIAVVLILGAGLMWFRRKYHSDSAGGAGGPSGTFSMDSIEEMHRSGMISDEEFRRLRNRSLGLDTGGPNGDNSTSSAPLNVDDSKGEADR